MFDSLAAVLEEEGLYEWEADGDDLLVCPCGYTIELDGVCPNGHRSPLLVLGVT